MLLKQNPYTKGVLARRTLLMGGRGEFLYLTDLSPRDAKWEDVKPQSQIVANAYAGTVYDKYYERMQDCSGWLRFALVPNDAGESIHKLQQAHLCHVRHCPVCQWRRSLMWRSRMFRALRRVLSDYPNKRFIYLTLTVKDPKMENLGETLTWMNDSWQRLVERKQFPALGWLRTTEVTRDVNGDPHPHFHALLMVNANYFGKGYVSHERWVELWRESLRVDYDPRVDIRVVKPRKPSSTDTSESQETESGLIVRPMDEGLVTAVRYTLKYSTKPDDFLSTDTSVSQNLERYKDWLLGLCSQLHKRRMVALGGIFKKYVSESDPGNLIVDSESSDTSETESADPRVTYVWRDEETRYLMKV